jgi:hypothetical protein
MTRRKHLRRVFILCCHCLRNLSYYRAGWSEGKLVFRNNFWMTVNGNFMDICVLEWCKLFADPRGKHFCKKLASDPATFSRGLLRELRMSEKEFLAYVGEVREYRDKFVAHLDLEEVMRPPVLEVIKKSVSYLYDYLLAHEDEGGYFVDALATSAAQFCVSVNEQAGSIYGRQKGT